jgi:hypothetical protein
MMSRSFSALITRILSTSVWAVLAPPVPPARRRRLLPLLPPKPPPKPLPKPLQASLAGAMQVASTIASAAAAAATGSVSLSDSELVFAETSPITLPLPCSVTRTRTVSPGERRSKQTE